MDFNDSKQESEFRNEARAWLNANAKKREDSEDFFSMFSERDDSNMVEAAKAWQAKKADAGWAGITWPKSFGGRGGSPMQSVIWGQEESKFNVPPNIFAIGIGMAGPTIMAHGTKEQKEQLLPPMLRGDEIWCQLFSEPGAGSDLAGLKTRAVKDGDVWVINGQKVWTSGAHYSDWGILVARTDFDAPKHKGITYFVVNMKSPGIEVRPIKQISGGANFNEVFFTDVRIPDSNRLGGVNKGWPVALTTLMNERFTIGGGGMMGGGFGFEDLVQLAKKFGQNGTAAYGDIGVRRRLADIYIRSKGLQYTGYRAITALSKGGIPGPEASGGKLIFGQLLQDMAALALEIQGPVGSLTEASITAQNAVWQEAFMWAPGIRIAGGTDEVLRNIIGERVLGLPGDVRVDKDVPFSKIPSGN